ncbi:MAG TPA: LptF/LptG family permease [Chthoniobacteraceae bacterium]|nr:LptF/LptG family permease [Chthoniobacteraceae bacterium]
MRLLDKYLLRNFLAPFLLCFFGFLSIWLIFDLSDHASDFIDGKADVPLVVHFYLTQLPQIAMISLPIGLLLALLFALSKMSRSNEIIAMLTAGQSLTRILAPLLVAGLVLTGVSTALNYQLAPKAESSKKRILTQLGRIKDNKGDETLMLEAQLFRNRADRRTWYVEEMPMEADPYSALEGVHITQQDTEGNIDTKWYARRAQFDPARKLWRFERGKTVHFAPNGDVISDDPWPRLEVSGWSETPWRIASSNIEAPSLSVPQLRQYLTLNADFPDRQLAPYRTHLAYRWALPWACLVVVLLAAPLGIVYSRRGVLAGVAGAIFLFAGNLFGGFLLVALGEGSILSPLTAAWGSNLFFAAAGLYLLYLRNTNRDFPSPFFWMRG